jgi:hypothetical protein
MNRLAHEKSPYLRHAAHQAIDWRPWSEEAFEQARQEDKPVFLSSGGVWCHWCHVMAKESFDDEEIARLLNELFITIKLDRDERPDIDRRYQQAVAAMGGGSGWPLSVFLTPDKEPFYGGTYYPPEDRQGRPGFGNVLKAVNNFYRTKREDVLGYSRRVMGALVPEPMATGELSESLLKEAETALLSQFDMKNGGFGTAPKFPMPGALEFLIRRSLASKDPAAGQAAGRMLAAMSQGGFHDQLGGGFHRYSVDEAWGVPHFEKMADDNAGLLRNYADGYASFGEERFRDVAKDILFFTRAVLADPAGGFYASQDADVTPDDEGGYFTWPEEEFRKALDPDEEAVLSAHLLGPGGAMHHDPAKKVLYAVRSPEELSGDLGKPIDEVRQVIARGKEKLLAARAKRETPFVDRTLYTSLNGMLIASWFHAYAVLGEEHIRDFAVKSLDRIVRERIVGGLLLRTEQVAAMLDDYVFLIDALVAGYEATGERGYLTRADELMAACLAKFHDHKEGGFFDTEGEVLGLRFKRMEDVPHASANAAAVLLLLKLSLITGREEYRGAAEQSLRIFSGQAREIGAHAGTYFLGLDASYRMLKLTVEAEPESELSRAARALSGRAYTAIVYGEDRGRVIPCKGTVCHEPVNDPSRLSEVCMRLS